MFLDISVCVSFLSEALLKALFYIIVKTKNYQLQNIFKAFIPGNSQVLWACSQIQGYIQLWKILKNSASLGIQWKFSYIIFLD